MLDPHADWNNRTATIGPSTAHRPYSEGGTGYFGFRSSHCKLLRRLNVTKHCGTAQRNQQIQLRRYTQSLHESICPLADAMKSTLIGKQGRRSKMLWSFRCPCIASFFSSGFDIDLRLNFICTPHRMVRRHQFWCRRWKKGGRSGEKSGMRNVRKGRRVAWGWCFLKATPQVRK